MGGEVGEEGFVDRGVLLFRSQIYLFIFGRSFFVFDNMILSESVSDVDVL